MCAAQAHPYIILLDLGLPDIAGDEVLRRLKADPATAPIPVVVVSGEPDAAERVPRDAGTGAVAVLQKPVRGTALCAVVDFVLGGRGAEATHAAGVPGAGRGPRQPQHREVVSRLLSRGSDSLVHQVYGRLMADRTCRHAPSGPPPPSWQDLARIGRQEGLLNDEEGALLAACPVPRVTTHGSATAVSVG